MVDDNKNLINRVTVNYSMPQTGDYLSDPDHARSHRIVAVNHSAPVASIGIDGDGNAIFKANVTLEDGGSISLQEDITFTGATGVNQIKFPDNLANALNFLEGANSYLTFITTNNGEAIRSSKVFLVGANAPRESWSTDFNVIELGGNTSLMANASAGAGKSSYLMQNAYWDGSNWKYQDTDEASFYQMGSGSHIFLVAASGTADANITWTTAMTIGNTANIGIGRAPTGDTMLVVLAPDAQSTFNVAIEASTLSDGVNNYGLIGTANGGGGTNNRGVYAQAANASANLHFLDGAGNNSTAIGWNDVSDPARKALIRDITSQQIEQMYNELDNCHIKSCRYREEMITHWEEEEGYIDEFSGIETGLKPIYGQVEDAPERFSFMANDPDLPKFLRCKDLKSINAGRIATYNTLMTQHHKTLIKELRQKIEVLEGI